MKLIYPEYGDTPLGHRLARVMIASVRKHMPGVYVVQETDDKSTLHPEADFHLVRPRNESRVTWTRKMDAEFDGECIFCDSDTVFRADIRYLFAKDFDVAACKRTIETPDQPWMGGFYLSRSQAFWRDIVTECLKMSPEDQDWYASQKAVPLIAHRYRILDLDARAYNSRPKSLKSDVSHAEVLHFRGRKELMLERDWS